MISRTLFRIFFSMCWMIPVKLVAQKDSTFRSNLAFSFGIKNHLPLHFFKRTYSYGLGAELSIEYKLSKKFAVLFKPGYIRYFYNQQVTGTGGSTGYVLLLGGAKFYPVPKIYIVAESGLGVKSSKFGNESALAYAMGAGYFFAKNMDLEIKYLKGDGTTFTPEVIGLNFGYTFYRNRELVHKPTQLN